VKSRSLAPPMLAAGAALAIAFLLVADAAALSDPHATAQGPQARFAFWAFLLGGLSAISLPLGSAVGLLLKPRAGVTAAAASFGAGALLAALSVELVAPTAHALTEGAPGHAGHAADPAAALVMLLLGVVTGGALFVILDQLVNAKGGYLRKTATTISHFTQLRNRRAQRTLEALSRMVILTEISTEGLRLLVDHVRPVSFAAGETIFREGDAGDRVYFIEEGEVAISEGSGEFTTLKGGDVLGEISVLTGAPRTAGAVARKHTKTLMLSKEDFGRLLALTPALGAATAELATKRLDELRERHETLGRARADWAKEAAEAIRRGAAIPSPTEVRQEARKHSGAPLAIWLGILLDGIPESFVIGAGFLALLTARLQTGTPSFLDVVPYTLIAGLFLSNFPEAMSSSVGMQSQGWGVPRILVLWSSLVVVTALGATLGYGIGAEVSPLFVVGIEGLAAGAMLTMIAQTMLPEAVHLGGPNIVGMSTLAGFVSAVAFKLLEA